MLKILCGVCLVVFSTFVGYFAAGKYRKKKNFIGQLNDFNERFLSELGFERHPLGEFFQKYEYKGEFAEFVEEYLRTGAPCAFSFLNADERNFVDSYFGVLGKGDAVSQSGFFTSVRGNLGALKAESEADAKKYGDLYLKLGFLCGLAVLIIMV